MTEILDRIAIFQLINAYSHFADRREPKKQSELFTSDATIEVYQGEPDKNKPIQILRGQKEFEEGFAGLNQYDTTTHFNGQSTITINNNTATGETYCLAHHVQTKQEQRTLLVMSIRYYDTFIKQNDSWFFSERKLIIDWTDSRLSMP